MNDLYMEEVSLSKYKQTKQFAWKRELIYILLIEKASPVMTLLVKSSYSHRFLSSSTPAMSVCSSFCPQLPSYFRQKPINSLPTKPLFPLSFKVFSSQATGVSAEADELPGRIGFLGMGIMGTPMAQNLLKAGCDVTVWNRTKSKCDPLISLGAKYQPSPDEVAASCDVTFAMLADPESAMDVACGKHGAASGMGPGKGYVDVSTVDGDTSKLINGHIKATGASFLEAPVSGSKKPAEDGQLIFLAAGDKSLYNTVAPLLDIMGKSRFYLGDVGNGAAMKLVVNMIMGSMMATFSEGLLLSEKVGLDPNVLVEVVSQGAISAPMYSLKGPSMIESLYPTAFPLKHQQKVFNFPCTANFFTVTDICYHIYLSQCLTVAGPEACFRISRICFSVYSNCSSCK
ncbi:glyoxylate/succinic semialdehyde reductase 2, chloroplastic isoform X1 [Citrus clementina]|nr:glyoxylate/succinic semialdehyde reductase 2, chloroplastic isoform X1 [Citrus x clementina]